MIASTTGGHIGRGRVTASTGMFVRLRSVLAALSIGLLIAGCAGFNPQPHDQVGFADRAVTQTSNRVTISTVALGPREAQAAFGVPMIKRGIQPVWVRVENARDETLYLLPLALDPMYFTPTEAAFINRSWLNAETNAQMDALFQEHGLPVPVEGGTTKEGFLFVPPDLGAKSLNFVYVGPGDVTVARFVVEVPGLALKPVDLATLYPPEDMVDLNDWRSLRDAIEELPCCVTNKRGDVEADPLNFVMIAERDLGFTALIGGGWDQTETVTAASALKTAMSFLFGSAYRYSPISDLYAFGRKQDAAFQIARSDIDERNHLRIWLTPFRFEGRPVWIGAISRDIGVILSGIGTTHKIDPDVDAERWYLAQSIIRAQALQRFGFAGGGPLSHPDNPRSSVEPKNIYYSDGRRIIMVLSDDPVAIDEIELIDWDNPDGQTAPAQ